MGFKPSRKFNKCERSRELKAPKVWLQQVNESIEIGPVIFPRKKSPCQAADGWEVIMFKKVVIPKMLVRGVPR
jgi:hypothetical protein